MRRQSDIQPTVFCGGVSRDLFEYLHEMRGGGKAAGLRHDLNIAFVRFQYFFGQIDAQAG